MSYWAEINENGLVRRVLVGSDNVVEAEAWLNDNLGGVWVQTFSDKSERYHFASIGYSYDADRDAFIPPQPFESWVLDEATCIWIAPITMPQDGGVYNWNEETLSWDPVDSV